jgi:hypothetical protein
MRTHSAALRMKKLTTCWTELLMPLTARAAAAAAVGAGASGKSGSGKECVIATAAPPNSALQTCLPSEKEKVGKDNIGNALQERQTEMQPRDSLPVLNTAASQSMQAHEAPAAPSAAWIDTPPSWWPVPLQFDVATHVCHAQAPT